MKRFKFTLEKVLEYRRELEMQRLLALGKAVEVFGRRQEELRRLVEELFTYRTRLAGLGVGKTLVRDLALYRSYLTYCEGKVEEAADCLRGAARELEQRRQELVGTSRDRRVMERLREIQRAGYDYEAAREETKELDEVAVKGFVAKQAREREPGGQPPAGASGSVRKGSEF